MKTNTYFQNELKLISILCGLAILQTQLPILSPGLKTLLESKVWRDSSALLKLSLLDQQYSRDFDDATHDQRRIMSIVRKKIEATIPNSLSSSK